MRVKLLLFAVMGAAVFVGNVAADPPQAFPLREPLRDVPTGACVDFAPGNVLTFTGLSSTFIMEKDWQVEVPGGFTVVSRTLSRLAGTATSGGYSYTLDATLHFYGEPFGDFQADGQTIIRRRDGRVITGDAHIFWNHLGGDVYSLEWLSGPRGADCH